MRPNDDTLSFPSLRPAQQPVGERAPEKANHPEAAQIARQKIAALAAERELPKEVPAVEPKKLVTNRQKLAEQVRATPLVKRRQVVPSALRPALTAIGIFTLILLIFKAPIIYGQLKYATTNQSTSAPAATQASAAVATTPTITIPKINVSAPIQFQTSNDETAIQKSLESGVVHYANTAMPGENGNLAIFGHSSNDWWEPGNYKFVFVLLDKLQPGDQFTIDYDSKRYTYEVTGSRVVLPTEVSVLNPTPDPTVSLITCTPPGTSLKRLVVTAKQIDPIPGPATTTPTTAINAQDSLPDTQNGGLFSGFGQAWNGIIHGVKSLFGADSDKDSSAPNQIPASK